MARHARRRNHLVPVLVAGTGLFGVGVLAGAAGAQPLGEAVPVPEPTVQLGPAIQVSRDNPTPHPPPEVAPVRRVARVVSPCSAKRAQLKAVETDLRAVYRTPTALELAEDAGVIARAVAMECGWEVRR